MWLRLSPTVYVTLAWIGIGGGLAYAGYQFWSRQPLGWPALVLVAIGFLGIVGLGAHSLADAFDDEP